MRDNCTTTNWESLDSKVATSTQFLRALIQGESQNYNIEIWMEEKLVPSNSSVYERLRNVVNYISKVNESLVTPICAVEVSRNQLFVVLSVEYSAEWPTEVSFVRGVGGRVELVSKPKN